MAEQTAEIATVERGGFNLCGTICHYGECEYDGNLCQRFDLYAYEQ